MICVLVHAPFHRVRFRARRKAQPSAGLIRMPPNSFGRSLSAGRNKLKAIFRFVGQVVIRSHGLVRAMMKSGRDDVLHREVVADQIRRTSEEIQLLLQFVDVSRASFSDASSRSTSRTRVSRLNHCDVNSFVARELRIGDHPLHFTSIGSAASRWPQVAGSCGPAARSTRKP